MNEFTKEKIEAYKDFDTADMHYYKSCLLQEMVYETSCDCFPERCPYIFVIREPYTECVLCSRLNTIK